MKKTIGVLFLLSLGISIWFFTGAKKPTLNDHEFVFNLTDLGYSIDEEIPTFSQIVNEATHIVYGKVIDYEAYRLEGYYNILVYNRILGNTEDEIIKVGAIEGLLEIGEEYLLFLVDGNMVIRPWQVFFPYNTLILKAEGNQLSRLINPKDNITVPPFAEDKYNKKDNFVKWLQKERKIEREGKIEKNTIKLEDLPELADVIVEIEVIDNDVVNEFASIIQVKVLKTYKGTMNNAGYVLPKDMKKGSRYLLFLEKYDSGALLPVERMGGYVEVGSDEYKELIKSVNANSKK